MEKQVFVTVGTTSFDELVGVVDSDEVVKMFLKMGYHKVLVQIGKGKIEPKKRKIADEHGNSIKVDFYRFKPTLQQDMEDSSLIISHAGAGSIMEALRLHKSLIVVVNSSLMNNHQTEIADAMSENKYALSTTPSKLLEVLNQFVGKSMADYLKPYPEPNLSAFPRFLNTVVKVTMPEK